jgi:hypothetical protein
MLRWGEWSDTASDATRFVATLWIDVEVDRERGRSLPGRLGDRRGDSRVEQACTGNSTHESEARSQPTPEASAELRPREFAPAQSQLLATIDAFRRLLGWKHLEVAEKLGVSMRTLTRTSSGDRVVDDVEIARLFVPRLRHALAEAKAPGQHQVLLDTLEALEHIVASGVSTVAPAHSPVVDDRTSAACQEVDVLLYAALEASEASAATLPP